MQTFVMYVFDDVWNAERVLEHITKDRSGDNVVFINTKVVYYKKHGTSLLT